MRIATYNFCRGGTDFNAPYRILQILQPDILFAQEVLPPSVYEEKAVQTWEDAGYAYPIWKGTPSHGKWGSAIFFKERPFRKIEDFDTLTGWMIGIELDASDPLNHTQQPLKLISVHTPTKENNFYPYQAQDMLVELRKHIYGTPTVMGGDFNVTISARNRTETPEVLPVEEEIMRFMRRTLGLVNCWQVANPNTILPRTFHGTATSNSHIDGIFVSSDFYKNIENCWIVGSQRGQWTEGDHYPVIAEFSNQDVEFKKQNIRTPR